MALGASLVASFVGDRLRRAAAGRGVPAELPGERLPDALGREAGHVARGDAAHHGAGQPGAARDPRRAQLRLAHRPGRSGRRSRRARTSPSCGSASTPRSTTQPTVAQDPGGRRRLPRPLPRPAHLPARSASRKCSPARAPRSSCASTAPTWTCCAPRPQEVGKAHRGRRRASSTCKVEPQVLVPQVEVRAAAGRGRALRPDAGRRPPRRRRRSSRAPRSARSTRSRRCSTWSCGACPTCARDLDRAARRCRSTRPPAAHVPLGDVADVAHRADAQRDQARERRRGASTSPATCSGRDLGSVAREIEAARPRACRFDRGYHPEFLGEYAAAAGVAAAAAALWRSSSLLGILLVLLRRLPVAAG